MSWCSLCAKRTPEQIGRLAESAPDVNAGLLDLLEDRDFERSISVGTGDRRRVRSRFARVDGLLPLRAGSPGDLSRLPLFGRRFQYLRADRISPAATYPRAHETAIDSEFLGARGEHVVNYLRHYQDSPVNDSGRHHLDSRSITLLSQTEAWLGELCPGVNLEAVGVEGTDLVRLSYGFGGRAGYSSSDRYRPTNVGFGLTYTLPIVVGCLTAGPGGMVLLENPEAHLHPRGQTRIAFLAARAAAAGAQLVTERTFPDLELAPGVPVRKWAATGQAREEFRYIQRLRDRRAPFSAVVPSEQADATLCVSCSWSVAARRTLDQARCPIPLACA